MAGGALVVDGAQADSGSAGAPGFSLSFTATLGTEAARHVGFAKDFNSAAWAMFSTAGGGSVLYARTKAAGAMRQRRIANSGEPHSGQ